MAIAVVKLTKLLAQGDGKPMAALPRTLQAVANLLRSRLQRIRCGFGDM